ncbi:GTP-binding protein At3g49725, chloroplastic [Linum perenne]
MLALSLKSLTQTAVRSPAAQSAAPVFSLLSSSFSSKQRNKGDGDDSLLNKDPDSPPRLFVVQPRLRPDSFLQAKLNEALCLANSLEEQRDGYFRVDFFDKELPPHILVQNPILRSSSAHADTYFGMGTVKEIKIHLNAADTKGDEVDAVFVNSTLSGVQQRNLERAWEKPVLDRVGLIIEIFRAHAHTGEAKLQAELATLMYMKSRLVRVRSADGRFAFGASGEAEVVSARGRGSGGLGFMSGAGETELQLQRRRILEKRSRLLSQIEEVRRTRALHRAARRRRGAVDSQPLTTVAVVGYTNAGKSTLVGALSNSDLYCDSRLFATLDPRLKSIVLPSGRKVLLSDTVGFISDLPIQLVQAFHATLEEVVEADLLLHVVDSTAPNLEEHRTTVLQVLQQIGVSEEKLQNMIEVWNKIDYEDEEVDDDRYLDDDGKEDDNAAGLSFVEEGGSEAIEIEEGDLSDGWLLSEDDGKDAEDDKWLESLNGTETDISTRKSVQSQVKQGPNLKISALTGVGLQELLELIDEKLKIEGDKLKARNDDSEAGFFDRKWRPPRDKDADIAT